MTFLTKAKTLTAVALTATAFTALPATASAADYRCEKKNDEAQVVGGLLGAVVGGVVGAEVAGRGDRNEGAVIGAVLGAGAGAALGDESVKCRREIKGTVRSVQHTQPRLINASHNGRYNDRRHYGNSRSYRHNNYGYNNRGGNYNRRLDRLDNRIYSIRAELKDLNYRNRFDDSRWIDRRRRALANELRDLKDRRRNVKRRGYSQHDNRRRGYNYRHGY